jgi:hypothetical protein
MPVVVAHREYFDAGWSYAGSNDTRPTNAPFRPGYQCNATVSDVRVVVAVHSHISHRRPAGGGHGLVAEGVAYHRSDYERIPASLPQPGSGGAGVGQPSAEPLRMRATNISTCLSLTPGARSGTTPSTTTERAGVFTACAVERHTERSRMITKEGHRDGRLGPDDGH